MKCENCGKNEVSFVYRSSINGINKIFFILLYLFNIKLPVTKLREMVRPECIRFTDIYTTIMDFEDRAKITPNKFRL